MDKLNKLSLPATIIIASLILGGFYYASQVNKQRSIERQQEIKIEQKRLEKEALNTCILDAEQTYSSQWDNEILAERKCALFRNQITFDEYAKQNNITQDKRRDEVIDFYLKKYECSSVKEFVRERRMEDSLNELDERLDKDKAECFKRYPQ